MPLEFPARTLLDDFLRREVPLDNGGKWALLPFAAEGAEAGETYTFEGLALGHAYWTPAEYIEPAVSVAIGNNGVHGHEGEMDLWLCLKSGKKEGYYFRFREKVSGPEGIWEALIEKWTEPKPGEQVGETLPLAAVELGTLKRTQGDQVGAMVRGSKLTIWHMREEGPETKPWTLVGEVTDSSFTEGLVGIEDTIEPNWINFEVGGEEIGSPPTVTKPGTQTGYVGTPISYQVKALHTTAYKATGLPAGLSINEATGKITGTPTTEEETTVTLTVTGPGGEASAEFAWKINPTFTYLDRQSMIL